MVDHVRARAAGGHPTDPSNLHVKPLEWNSRKGAYEGQLIEARRRYIERGLTPTQADELLAPEWEWLMNDVIPRPMDPECTGHNLNSWIALIGSDDGTATRES